MTSLVAQQSLLNEVRTELGDASFKAQVDRWTSKPLNTDDENLAKFGSFKGRGACLINFVATPVREGYREGKNVLVLAEKIFNFVRVFFETLFREEGRSWGDCRERFGDILSSFAALFGRVFTVVLDELKLGAGILYPGAAISVNKSPVEPEEITEDDTEDTPEVVEV